MPQSKFVEDLEYEKKLASFLDNTYYRDKKIFPQRFTLQRVTDLEMQHKGVDLIIYNQEDGQKIYIDEKAQAHYINKSLPTFAFELSYLKENNLKIGWFYDKRKITQQYFLITCIEVQNKDIKSCRLICVDRVKLQTWLEMRGLSYKVLLSYENKLRQEESSGKHLLTELSKNEGFLYYTTSLVEKPINIVLYLNVLLNRGIATEFFPCKLI